MKPITTFAVGPSQIYFTVEGHIRQAFRDGVHSLSHRSKAFEKIFQGTTESLRALLGIPSNYEVFFTASATEVWERAIQNLVTETSFHFVNGAFSEKFFETSKQLGRKANAQQVKNGHGFSTFDTLADAELIGAIANETSTGVTTSNDFFGDVQKKNPDALIITDAVSAWPYQDLDLTLMDSCFFSVQKGFGLPAGLGVWLVNDQCISKAEERRTSKHDIGSYHSIPSLLAFAKKNQTPETPNVLAIYLLGKICEDFLRRGIQTIRQETDYKAAILYHALENHSIIKPYVEEKKWRSKTILVAQTGGLTEKLIAYLQLNGIEPGEGYGASKKDQLRFGNFPAHSKEEYEKLVDLIRAFE